MNEHFPVFTARHVVTAVMQLGFVLDHQRGSHAFYRNPITKRIVVIPMHSGELKRKTVSSIIKQSGFSRDEFVAATK